MMKTLKATLAIVGLLATGSQLVLVSGCSASSGYPAGPVVLSIPASFDYTTNPQTYALDIGESVPFSAQINDDGNNTLTFSGTCQLSQTGNAFQLVTPCPAVSGGDGGPATSLQSPPAAAIVQVIFTPTAAEIYTGAITLQTNAVNDGGLLTIPIRALGVNPDAGIPADAGVLADAGLYDGFDAG